MASITALNRPNNGKLENALLGNDSNTYKHKQATLFDNIKFTCHGKSQGNIDCESH